MAAFRIGEELVSLLGTRRLRATNVSIPREVIIRSLMARRSGR